MKRASNQVARATNRGKEVRATNQGKEVRATSQIIKATSQIVKATKAIRVSEGVVVVKVKVAAKLPQPGTLTILEKHPYPTMITFLQQRGSLSMLVF